MRHQAPLKVLLPDLPHLVSQPVDVPDRASQAPAGLLSEDLFEIVALEQRLDEVTLEDVIRVRRELCVHLASLE